MATEHAVGLATIAKLTAAAQVDREERSGLETRVAVAEMRAQQAAAELRSLRAAVATKEAAPVATADEPPADPIAG
jgi:hypothetical protein